MSLVRLDADGEQTQEGGLDNTADAEAPTTETIAESQGDPWARGQNHSKPAANDAESRYWASLNAAAQERAQTLQIEDWGNGTTGQATGTTGQAELCKVYYFHTDQVGMPQELSNSQGQLVWQASYKTWGSTVAEEWEIKSLSGNAVHQLDRGDSPQAEDERQQNLRFQGQYLDRETGLHYNTFRYYDADIGRFISPDPIGLNGDINLHAYAPNPISNIDPFGWDWNYNLTDANGNVYYHGRASDNQTMADVIRRHSSNTGYDGVRLGSGDTINQVTPHGTDPKIVRGIEDSGIREKPLLGRGSGNVRGNVINGISDAKKIKAEGIKRARAAIAYLKSMGVDKVSKLKSLASKKC